MLLQFIRVLLYQGAGLSTGQFIYFNTQKMHSNQLLRPLLQLYYLSCYRLNLQLGLHGQMAFHLGILTQEEFS